MTDNGFMTEAAWVQLTPSMAAGVRSLPVVQQMPDWWTLKIVDSFGAHTSSLEAMQIYADSKILLVKEVSCCLPLLPSIAPIARCLPLPQSGCP